MLKLDASYLKNFIRPHEYEQIAPFVRQAHEMLLRNTGPGNDYTGWLDLPHGQDKAELARLKEAAARIRSDSQALVVIGIGGSYLGARAAIEFLKSSSYNLLPKDSPDVFFAGNTLSPDSLNELLALIEGRDVSLNVISKSGTTTEPALAFRVLRGFMEKKYGREGAAKRIYCTTDRSRGMLKSLADREGYECFAVPDDVGGRYSVLTPVGLLPIAVAGCDIDALLDGAAEARYAACSTPDPNRNDACKYAAIRSLLLRKGIAAEVLVTYEPAFVMLGEWYKQLFGESEGKDGKGLYPTSMCFTTDLHSLGQFVQDGSGMLFETVLRLAAPKRDFFIPKDPEDLDGLNFLAERNLSEIGDKAFLGTVLAHVRGGVPNVVLELPNRSERELGALVYFFEFACAVSGYLLAVNPFDQPGVEEYKRNMFALLGKPGYEEQRRRLEAMMGER